MYVCVYVCYMYVFMYGVGNRTDPPAITTTSSGTNKPGCCIYVINQCHKCLCICEHSSGGDGCGVDPLSTTTTLLRANKPIPSLKPVYL